jgi:hypothetical protein
VRTTARTQLGGRGADGASGLERVTYRSHEIQCTAPLRLGMATELSRSKTGGTSSFAIAMEGLLQPSREASHDLLKQEAATMLT